MSDNPTLVISVNGEERRMPGGVSVASMLGELGIDHRKVAVERNREILPRGTLGNVQIAAGDAFEIVHFVGGG
jgi:thiazole synthase